jgi:hypothetical protein
MDVYFVRRGLYPIDNYSPRFYYNGILSWKAGFVETIIRDEKFIKIADSVKPDAKRRLYLPKTLIREGVTYHIYANALGQIVLDPQITIPASEAWLFENKAALASVDRGMTESAKGQVIDKGSFSGYSKDAI